MTKTVLLEQLGQLTREVIKDAAMPVRTQEGDKKQRYRAADVYLMRLPDSSAAKKKAPYVIHQLITAKDWQAPSEHENASAVVRSVFCTYSPDEQEGALLLLDLMERLRIRLLQQVIVGKQFELDLEAGLEALIYTDDTAPYYAGEMVSTWKLPAIKREVDLL